MTNWSALPWLSQKPKQTESVPMSLPLNHLPYSGVWNSCRPKFIYKSDFFENVWWKKNQKWLQRLDWCEHWLKSCEYIVGFPRDGTSRDKPGRDVLLSLCPGTKKFPCPVVPLFRDKKNPFPVVSFVPGQSKVVCPFFPWDKKILSRWKLYGKLKGDKNITPYAQQG